MKKLLVSIAATTLAIAATFSMAGCEQLSGLLENILPQNSSTSPSDSSTPPANSSTPPASSTPDKPAQPHEADLNDVKDFVYTPMLEQNVSTRKDYTVQNSYSFIGSDEVYDISWSVDVEEGVTIVEGEESDTVDISDTLEEDLPYVLTGTITCPDGCCSISFDLERTALKALNMVPVAITEKPAENTAYKFHIYQANLGKDLYFAGTMDGYYGKTTEDYDAGVDLYVEYAANSEDNFYIYFGEGTEKQYISVKQSGTHINFGFGSEAVTLFTFSEEIGSFITIDTFEKENSDKEMIVEACYLGTYDTYNTVSASQLYHAETGFVGGLVTMVDKSEVVIPDEKKVSDVKAALSVEEKHRVDRTVELPTVDDRYPEVTITWTVEENKGATVTDDGLVLVIPEEATTATLTATIKSGDVTDTKEFTLTLGPKTVIPEADSTLTIPQAIAIGESTNGTPTTDKYYTSGKITGFYGDKGTTYGNVYIEDEAGDSILVYGLYSADGSTRYDAMTTKPVVGDTITVYGVLTSYNGTAQFKDAWMTAHTPGEGDDTPEATNPVISFADKANRTELTEEKQVWVQNGITVTNNKGASTNNVADYSNPARFYKSSSLTVEYEGMAQIVFVCNSGDYANALAASIPDSSASVVTDGAKVTVTFTKANSFTIETLSAQVRVNEISVYTEAQEGGEEEPVDPEAHLPADGSNLTIDEVLALEISGDTTRKYYVTATLKEVYNTTYGNMYVTDEDGTELTVYGSFNEDGSVKYANMENKPNVGDTIKFYSILSTYSGKNQLKNAWIIEVTPGESEEEPVDPEAHLPADGSNLTIDEVLALEISGDTTRKYYVTATLKEVYNTTYGNMYVTDEDGTELTVYGSFNEDGSVKYANMENKPNVGDTIKFYSILSTYSGKNQLKNAWIIEVTPGESEEPEVPVEPEEPETPETDVLATFEFGDNGEATHVDGNAISEGTAYTAGNYTLTLTGVSKVYDGAYDATGKSCIKLGTSSAVATFNFEVDSTVNKVVINVAKYKAKTTKLIINDTEYEITTSSNDGAYTTIEIDTTTTKTVTVATVSGACRAMIDSIVFIG